MGEGWRKGGIWIKLRRKAGKGEKGRKSEKKKGR